MKDDIEQCKALNVNGIVIGILKENGHIDIERTRQLVLLANPMKVTFNRAFDMTVDPFIALQDIISIGGIQRILTSGQESTCLEGLETLCELVRRAKDQIIILPGGGLTERNLKRVLGECRALEFHISARSTRDSKMSYRNLHCFLGGSLRSSEFTNSTLDPQRLDQFLRQTTSFDSKHS